MNATSQLTEEHAQQIHDAIEEAQAENGKVEITFGVNRRYVRIWGLLPARSTHTDRISNQPFTRDVSQATCRREITQYL